MKENTNSFSTFQYLRFIFILFGFFVFALLTGALLGRLHKNSILGVSIGAILGAAIFLLPLCYYLITLLQLKKIERADKKFGSDALYIYNKAYNPVYKSLNNLIIEDTLMILGLVEQSYKFLPFLIALLLIIKTADRAIKLYRLLPLFKFMNLSALKLSDVFIHGTISLASPVILPFFVHAERIPAGGTVDILFFYVVHTYGYPQYGRFFIKICLIRLTIFMIICYYKNRYLNCFS